MKAFAVALVLSLSLLGAERALAADLPLPGGAPIPPSSYYPISPPVNWGGVYIGLNGGYGLGSSSWSNSKGSTGNFADNGGVVGGTLGINYAGFGDWVLFGIEGDFDWSGATGSGACANLGRAGQRDLSNQDRLADHVQTPGWLHLVSLPLLRDRRRRGRRLPAQP